MKPNISIVEANFAAAARSKLELPPPTQIEIAFAGRSNVGKSSLLNRIMNRKSLARTSSTPGCTRQLNFFNVRTADGLLLTLVDLPGYGYAQRSKTEKKAWAELIEGYLLERPTLAAVLVLVDARRGLETEEENLFEMLEGASAQRKSPATLLVGTKLDKMPASSRKVALQKIAKPGRPVLGFSTELPETATELWAAIRRAIEH